jgi:hypothetical protein
MESIGYRKASEMYPDYEWNYYSDWAIPVPVSYFQVGKYGIIERWFVPSEVPVLTTGWLYRLKNNRVVTESELYQAVNSVW